jgi:hypothetical protein
VGEVSLGAESASRGPGPKAPGCAWRLIWLVLINTPPLLLIWGPSSTWRGVVATGAIIAAFGMMLLRGRGGTRVETAIYVPVGVALGLLLGYIVSR